MKVQTGKIFLGVGGGIGLGDKTNPPQPLSWAGEFLRITLRPLIPIHLRARQEHQFIVRRQTVVDLGGWWVAAGRLEECQCNTPRYNEDRSHYCYKDYAYLHWHTTSGVGRVPRAVARSFSVPTWRSYHPRPYKHPKGPY